MNLNNHIYPVLFIVGPTAVGKSKLAFGLAKKVNGVILNCDSVQLYQHVEIGAAKPTKDELKLIPHELINIIPFPEVWTVGDYFREAQKVLKKITKENPVIIVGGSGFYIQALLKGMGKRFNVDNHVQLILDKELKEFGLEKLYIEFKSRDPQRALKVMPEDTYRIIRGLSIMRSYNKSLTELEKLNEGDNYKFPYNFNMIGLKMNRIELKDIVKSRVDKMISLGLIDEVKDLIANGMSDWSPLNSIGYKEVKEALDLSEDFIDIEKLKSDIVSNTMKLAKKQMTWFKRDPSILWFDGQKEWDQALIQGLNFLSREYN